jgi:peptidylprolyl isomerase
MLTKVSLRVVLLAVAVALTTPAALGQARRPLSPADIDDIATLLKLEDTRMFDEAALARTLKSAHPEVRRRAAVSIGRIANEAGRAMLVSARNDSDVEVVASVAFATGQLADPAAVEWLGGLLDAPAASPIVGREAAQALGKIRSTEARAALIRYLGKAPATAAAAPVVGEALLSLGRFAGPVDLPSITRWLASTDVEVRWRAAWSLFRPRDPAAVPHLLKLIGDPSGEVRHWAVRGLTPAMTDGASVARPATTARLRTLVLQDPDRRVRTEALRTLVQYDDETAFGVLVNALYSPDSWIAVSAAEGAGRFTSRANVLTPLLIDVAEPADPLSVRITVLPALVALAPDATKTADLAVLLVQSGSTAARNAAFTALRQMGGLGRAALEQLAANPATAAFVPPRDQWPAAGPARAGGAGDAAARGGGAAGRAAGGGGGRGGAAGRAAGRGRGAGGGRGRGSQTPRPARPDAEYRQLVERWIVPDYNGRPRPRAIWETARGSIEIELYPGDAPFGVEHFFRTVESGDIVGTEFTRLVPDFVAQQQAIRNAVTLRDEVNRHGLTRGNLSWASAGLDTGRPGYTLGHTPQPHNEGSFTALGRIVAGMDVVDKLELGDKITAARIR